MTRRWVKFLLAADVLFIGVLLLVLRWWKREHLQPGLAEMLPVQRVYIALAIAAGILLILFIAALVTRHRT